MKLVFIFAIIFAPAAYPQAVQVSLGTSTLYSATGGEATAYFANQTDLFSVGVENGKFIAGFSNRFKYEDYDVIAGDSPFSLSAPGGGLGFISRGITIGKKSDRRTFSIFLGATGGIYSAPYLTTANTPHFGAGFKLKQQLTKNWDFQTATILDGSLKTFIAGANYTTQKLNLQGAAGLLENKPYYAGILDYRPVRFVDATAAHTTYVFKGQQINVNSLGGSVTAGAVNFHSSVFESANSSGQDAGVGVHAWILDGGSDFLHSAGFPNTIFSHVTEHVSRRVMLSQFITMSNGRTTIAYGGGYISNALSIDVGYSTYFMPLFVGRSPFTQALTINVGIHVGSLSLHTGTNILPTGQIRWSAYGNDWAYGPLASSRGPEVTSVGKYSIRGTVVNAQGEPVDGACIQLAKNITCTDSEGAFEMRESKARSFPVAVPVEQFLAPGEWEVVSAPATVQAEIDPQVVKIIVRRK